MFSVFRRNRYVVACRQDEMKDGEMREVEVGKSKVLVVKDAGQFYALGNKCTHYAAPLIKGVACNGHVRCPFHGACFDLKTGDIEDFPGIDSLPRYEVRVEGGEVRVMVTEGSLQPMRRQKTLAKKSPRKDKRTFVIVGGGPAAASCAETLRQEGFEGQLIVLTKEPVVPYDRPKLSKALNMTIDDLAIRPHSYYSNHGIDFRFNSEVTSLDTAAKTVALSGGEKVKYDKVVIATGAIPRPYGFIENNTLKNIHTLRTVEDANTIARLGAEKDVLIIGTSFIGVETAATLVAKAKSVTIVDLVEAPFQLALGKEVGYAVKKMLEEKGVKFYFKNSVTRFLGDESGALTGAVLKDGTQLQAELCVIGIGVGPATAFLKDSGLNITDRGFISVEKTMQTSCADVFAAGDVTHFPLFMMDDERVNIQHWQMALKQGQIAALNMLGKRTDIKSVPFFWTVVFGKSLRYCGYGVGYDDIVLHGSLDDLQFVAYYTKGDRVVAVASMNYDPIVSQTAEMFLAEKTLKKAEVLEDPKAWTSRLETSLLPQSLT